MKNKIPKMVCFLIIVILGYVAYHYYSISARIIAPCPSGRKYCHQDNPTTGVCSQRCYPNDYVCNPPLYEGDCLTPAAGATLLKAPTTQPNPLTQPNTATPAQPAAPTTTTAPNAATTK